MELVWQAEDSLRERKTESDLKDLLKTLVAFANSVAPGDTAQIFIGEKDDGTVAGVTNADNIQKKVREECDKIYPEIYFRTEAYQRDAKTCVRVDIKHNGLAPHFGGQSWVRRGAVTVRATEAIYQQMVDLRQSKVSIMAKYLNQDVSIALATTGTRFFSAAEVHSIPHWSGVKEGLLKAVNPFWATFDIRVSSQTASRKERSESMERILLSWDDERRRLKVLMRTDL